MNRLSKVSVLFLVGALGASACGGSGDVENDGARSESEMLEDSLAHDSVADSAAAGSRDTTADDPFTGFELDAGPAVTADRRRIALLLRNQDARTAIVYADGGAGEVLLDSVAPGADSRVDILSRAATIALRSVTPEGDLLRSTEVSPGPDTIVAVIIGPAAATP